MATMADDLPIDPALWDYLYENYEKNDTEKTIIRKAVDLLNCMYFFFCAFPFIAYLLYEHVHLLHICYCHVNTADLKDGQTAYTVNDYSKIDRRKIHLAFKNNAEWATTKERNIKKFQKKRAKEIRAIKLKRRKKGLPMLKLQQTTQRTERKKTSTQTEKKRKTESKQMESVQYGLSRSQRREQLHSGNITCNPRAEAGGRGKGKGGGRQQQQRRKRERDRSDKPAVKRLSRKRRQLTAEMTDNSEEPGSDEEDTKSPKKRRGARRTKKTDKKKAKSGGSDGKGKVKEEGTDKGKGKGKGKKPKQIRNNANNAAVTLANNNVNDNLNKFSIYIYCIFIAYLLHIYCIFTVCILCFFISWETKIVAKNPQCSHWKMDDFVWYFVTRSQFVECRDSIAIKAQAIVDGDDDDDDDVADDDDDEYDSDEMVVTTNPDGDNENGMHFNLHISERASKLVS